jgi:hypothetical protein
MPKRQCSCCFWPLSRPYASLRERTTSYRVSVSLSNDPAVVFLTGWQRRRAGKCGVLPLSATNTLECWWQAFLREVLARIAEHQITRINELLTGFCRRRMRIRSSATMRP